MKGHYFYCKGGNLLEAQTFILFCLGFTFWRIYALSGAPMEL